MKTSALGLGMAAVVASAAYADFTGVIEVAGEQTVTEFDGTAVTIWTVDLYAVADDTNDILLNVYDKTLVGAPASFYQSATGVGWKPTNLGGPFDNEANRKGDSFVTIGGFDFNGHEQAPGAGADTGLDPNFGSNSDDTPGALAGWFNSNPPGLAGQVGTTDAGLGVIIGRFSSTEGEFSLVGTNLSLTGNKGLGTDAEQGSFVVTAIPAPGALALLAVAGLAGRRRRG